MKPFSILPSFHPSLGIPLITTPSERRRRGRRRAWVSIPL